jgi:hypothetical protein
MTDNLFPPQYRFPVHDLKSAEAIDSMRFKVKPMTVQIAGRHDLHFDFFSPQARAKVSYHFWTV